MLTSIRSEIHMQCSIASSKYFHQVTTDICSCTGKKLIFTWRTNLIIFPTQMTSASGHLANHLTRIWTQIVFIPESPVKRQAQLNWKMRLSSIPQSQLNFHLTLFKSGVNLWMKHGNAINFLLPNQVSN